MKTNSFTSSFEWMAKFFQKLLMLSLPILCCIVAVNYIGDAANLYKSDYESRMAEIIHSDSFVTNISNYDERTLQKEVINRIKKAPYIVVIGSSRTMLINESMVYPNSMFNNSVSGASLNDLIAIYQLYKERDILPGKIILGIDPWMFNNNRSENRWKSLELEFNSFYNENSKPNAFSGVNLRKWFQLFSISYFQISIRRIDDKLRRKDMPVATDSPFNTTNTKLSDGSLTYGEAFRMATSEKVKLKIEKYIEGDIYGMKGFDGSYSFKMKSLKDLCADILKNNVKVEFFLSPYPLKSYNQLTAKYPSLLDLEVELNSYADSLGIRVMGSYDPSKYGFKDSYFYDGMHAKEEAIVKIIRSR